MLSASDIETYRTCPLKYKFARVFRIPSEPTMNQRFGILVHQVLERYHGEVTSSAGCERARGRPEGETSYLPELLELLEAGWRRGGFGDSEEERQFRAKATAALVTYHDRFATRTPSRCGSSRRSSSGWARTCCAGASTASTSCRTAATS